MVKHTARLFVRARQQSSPVLSFSLVFLILLIAAVSTTLHFSPEQQRESVTGQLTAVKANPFQQVRQLSDITAISFNLQKIIQERFPGTQEMNTACTPVGTNVGVLEDWSWARFYANQVREMREWSEKSQITLNSAGWPTSLGSAGKATSYLYCDVLKSPSGTFKIYAQGNGDIVFKGNVQQQKTIQVRGTEIIDTVQINQASGGCVIVEITSILNANDPPRFELYPPGHDRGDDWYKPTIQYLLGFKALRFLDANGINNAFITSWNQRTLPTYRVQTGGCCVPSPSSPGMSYEDMVGLAEAVNADLWVNIPHPVDNNYITQLGTQILKPYLQRNPNHNVYVEYSNEVWNGQFSQATYARVQGLARGYDPTCQLTPPECWLAGTRFTVARSVEIFDLLNQALGTEASRMKKVIGTQIGNAGITTQICQALGSTQYNPRNIQPDAIAGTTYFGDLTYALANKNTITPAGIVQQAVTILPSELGTVTRDTLREITNNCPNPQTELITYEGGQHMVTNDPVLKPKIEQANTDPTLVPHMGDAYDTMFQVWDANNPGGHLVMHYMSTYRCDAGKGCWGAREYEDQDPSQAQKYLSLQRQVQCGGGSGVPTLVAFQPSTISGRNPPLTLDLLGTNFDPSAIVVVNDLIVYPQSMTQWKSSTQITLTLPRSIPPTPPPYEFRVVQLTGGKVVYTQKLPFFVT